MKVRNVSLAAAPARAEGRLALTALGLAVGLAACGGGGYSSSPSTPSAPAAAPAASASVTITGSGVEPKTLQVALGARVTFVNNDSQSHQIASDPNPAHTDCPAINDLAVLAPGQSRQTGPLGVARACGYHDHMHPDSLVLQGKILVGGAQDPGTPY